MNERCDVCGKVMRQADYDGVHATVHIGVSGKVTGELALLGDVGSTLFADSWYLMCPECYGRFKELLYGFAGR